jgi:cytochrome c-type biogenesis protein CcmH/NrfG
MKDLLEKMIRDNKNALEEDAPMGHFERFEAKLDKEFKHRNKFGAKFYLQLAASLVFVLLLGNQLRIYFAPEQPKQHEETMTLSSVSDEYREVEFYFTSAINQGMTEWDKLIEAGFISEADQQMMTNEINEFDRMQEQLQKELQANPDDERVINAMLDYYQARLSITTLIIDKLKEVKNQKLTHNETEI